MLKKPKAEGVRGFSSERDWAKASAFWSAGLKALAFCCALGAGIEAAKAGAGTATPPAPGLGAVPPLSVRPPTVLFTGVTDKANTKAFTVVGFLQDATVSDKECPPVNNVPTARKGGTAVVNGLSILIPCNTTLQMPAATFAWEELFDQAKFPASLKLAVPTASGGFDFPSTEVTIIGNVVGGRHIAGLVFISQQSLNIGTGTITDFDYGNGIIYVAGQGGKSVRLQLNDPKITDKDDPAIGTGRFSAGQSPDTRFRADQDNPTIRAITGYPMCVPRFAPPAPGAAETDPRCPQRNRPKAPNCRKFADANVILPSGFDLPAPAAGQVYCSSFLMGDPIAASTNPNLPDSTQQAPFEIGDLIRYSGTLLRGDAQGPGGSDTISVHTIEANVGIYTWPGTLPAYLSITSASVSGESTRTELLFNGIPQESPDRLVLDAMVTDVTSVVDIYLVDIDPDPKTGGAESQRWITPASMTGGVGTFGSNKEIINGGITTQFTGPVPGRARIRANKATPLLLFSPTRYIRVAVRSLCDPANINGAADKLPRTSDQTSPTGFLQTACLNRAKSANGLNSGQYLAPVSSFLFPEALVPGDPTAPNDFWQFGFLVNGEGPGNGALIPRPW